MLKILEPNQPATKGQIIELEEKLNAKLPEDYINFLLKYNGGCTGDYDAFYMHNEKLPGFNHSAVNYFCGINEPEETLDIYYNIKTFKDDYRIPKDLMPVAHDPCGNIICICYEGDNYGKIYLWDHEFEADEGEPVTYDNVFFVANSFTEFLDNLHDSEYDDKGNMIKEIYPDGRIIYPSRK